MSGVQRFSRLSQERQFLVRLCQTINYGHIRALVVMGGEPVLSPPPTVVLDVKLNQDDRPRAELNISDFDMPREVCRLFEIFDQTRNGRVADLEIRAGVPRRCLFESPVELLPGM